MRAVLVLSLVGLSCANVVFRDAETNTAPVKLFSQAELQCLLDDKVLHSDGQCYTLKQTGPCGNDDMWLVLDNSTENSRNLVCKRRPCNKPLTFYWARDGVCHKAKDQQTLCPHQNNVLRTDSYGEGECACAPKFVRLERDVISGRNTDQEWVGDCHPLFNRGPCPPRQILHPVYMQGHGMVGQCQRDPCAAQNTGTAVFVQYPANGSRCYELDTRGPCPPDQTLSVYPKTSQPKCYNLVQAVTPGDVARCEGNVNLSTLECREEVEIKITNNPFVTEVTSGRRKRGRRRAGR